MKKLIYLFLFFVAFAQAQITSTVPQGISYQGMARKVDGSILTNTVIAARFKILPVGGGAAVYTEAYTGTTGLTCNNAGIFTASIGSVDPATFKTIDWAADKYEIQVEIDITNSTIWSYVGTQPFKSVPYAFHSADGVLWKGNFASTPTFTVPGSVFRNSNTGVTYYRNGLTWDTLAFSNGLNFWKRNPIGTINNVYLANNADYVSIGLPFATTASEKLHVHNNTGDSYIQLTTATSTNNVGLVFGQASTINKGLLSFDNNSNSLTYSLFGKRKMMIEGATGEALFGKIPIGVASNAGFTIYDSSASPRPSLLVLNRHSDKKSTLRLGTSSPIGIDLVFEKNFPDVFKIKPAGSGPGIFTFGMDGKFYPNSDGTVGTAFIEGGATTSDNLYITASTTGNIINDGYTQLGNNGIYTPGLKVLEFVGTMPATAGAGTSIGLTSYISGSDKIVDVSIFVNDGTYMVPPGYPATVLVGYEYYYLLSSSSANILISTTAGNSGNILNKPFRALVTIKK